MTKNNGGGATKLKYALPMGVNGTIKPKDRTAKLLISKNLLGLLFQNGDRRVRITKITTVCVAKDSRNQAVWNREFALVKY